MPEERRIVDGNLRVKRPELAGRRHDQRVDLAQHRLDAVEAVVELVEDRQELVPLGRILEPCGMDELPPLIRLIADERLDVDARQRVRIASSDLLDLDAALRGQEEQRLLRTAVECHREVVLLGDLRRTLDPDAADDMAADLEPEDVGRARLRLVGLGGEPHAARLAAAAREYLCLHDHGAAELLGSASRLHGGCRQPAFRDRNPVPPEELLALMLVEVQGADSSSGYPRRVDTIAVEGLRKRYGQVQALDGVSFVVQAGEIFALLGPNGAGKSTAVRVLVTLTQPDEGRASVAGHDVEREPDAVRRTIGYIPQESGVDRFGTGRENLMLQGRVQGMRGRALRVRVDELLELVGIADAADRVVNGYSGGMKRRLDIALGLVHRPRVLFLDEPTTGLDPEARVALWEEVGRLAGQETLTILLTTHYLEEADELADRLAIVSAGRVVVEGTPTDLKAELRGDAVTVELANGRVDDARQVLARIQAPVETTLGDGRTLVSRVADGGQALPGILAALGDAGIAVTSVAVSRPSLDDVYLHYTGREFASEDRGE